jgi:hypothetical protein
MIVIAIGPQNALPASETQRRLRAPLRVPQLARAPSDGHCSQDLENEATRNGQPRQSDGIPGQNPLQNAGTHARKPFFDAFARQGMASKPLSLPKSQIRA